MCIRDSVGYENAEGNTGANSFTEGAGYFSTWTFTNTLTYNNVFGEHNLKVLAGTEAFNSFGRGLSGTRSSYFSEDPNYWTLNSGSPIGQSNAGAPNSPISVWSQLARVEYSYAGKYILNGTIRRDQTSVFVEDQRVGYFPGVSVAWRISQENFLKNVSWISDLKLRYSWADLGTYSDVQDVNSYN